MIDQAMTDGVHAPASGAVPLAAAPDIALDHLMRSAVDHMRDMVLITEAAPLDRPGPRIVYVNEAFERQTGYSASEMIGKTPRILQGPNTEPDAVRRIAVALRRCEPLRIELINYRRDGSEFNIEMDIVPGFDTAGRHTHWASIQRDVTARKQAEADAARREAQRVESLGTLAAGIAHDFNNIVAAILGNVEIARQDAAIGLSVLPSIEQISGAAVRARSMVRQILAYSQRQPQAFVAQDLGPILDEACSLLRSTMPATVSLQIDGAGVPMSLLANGSQLHQVFVNLGINAWQAMQGGTGHIEVRARVVDDADAAVLKDGAAAAAPRTAVISFRDDGCGMDTATAARVFEPYFTTKSVGNGTGLGLSVVWGIVGAHRATIAVESEPGRGTTFILRFPLIDSPTGEVEQNAQPERLADGRPAAASARPAAVPRVMLVDDDVVILITLDAVLTRVGFAVETFADPALALAAFSSRPQDFDVVVTDFNMPDMSGLQLAARMLELSGSTRVVLGSGYLSDDLRRAAREAGVASVYGKEFAPEDLPQLLRNVLANTAQS